jgi:class 3 adenylate cyclase
MAEERLQRRLAAILSADVVGYSRLMGIDEAGTLARLKATRRELIDPLIAAHSGRTFKLANVISWFGRAFLPSQNIPRKMNLHRRR